ncbi:hypothetical protein ACI48D_01425 [Massilia sp. LXY-6]|uniref:hypothetical protein n=1 Tax=Massilia sp. LXY-6 TaxID=3379823 RepID=UPI003EDF5DFD
MYIGFSTTSCASDESVDLEQHHPAPPRLSLRLTDEVIGKAVKETLAEQAKGRGLGPEKTLSGDAYQKFERAFSEAEKPDCLHPDAMKFQPHSLAFKIGGQTYGIGVGGQLAIPFWIAAIVRGKCH